MRVWWTVEGVMTAIWVVELVRGWKVFVYHLSQRQHPACILVQQIYPGRVVIGRSVGLLESEWVAEEAEES